MGKAEWKKSMSIAEGLREYFHTREDRALKIILCV